MDEKSRTPEARARLARAVKNRRHQLELTQPQLVAAGGPSVSLISRIESGKPGSYDEMSILRLERALQWAAGSVEAILDGSDPTPAGERTPGKAAEPPLPLPAAPQGGPAPETTASDQIKAHLEAMQRRQEERLAAMQRQQDELLREVKGLRRQLDDLHRKQEQEDHGSSGGRKMA